MNRAEKRRRRKLAGQVAANGQSVDPTMDQAMGHHAAGRLSKARNIYRRVLRSDPEHPVALHLLGVLAHQTGQNETAIELIGRALAIKPEYMEAHGNLGNVLRELGRLDDAVASFKRAIAINPDAEAYNNLGITYSELGRGEEAVAAYRKALTIKPEFAQAHNNLGNALQHQGKLNGAVSSFRMAIAIDPGQAESHNNLGTALQHLGQLEQAVASYHTALAIRPEFTSAHYNLGNGLTQQGLLSEAAASFRKALSIDADFAAAHNSLGGVLMEQGRSDEAIASFRKALAIRPDFAAAHGNLAEALEKTNRIDELRQALNEAERHCPGHPLLSIGEAQVLKRSGDYAAAMAVLEAMGKGKGVDEGEGGGDEVNFLLDRAYLLGELCDRLGDVDAAYGYFREGNSRSLKTARAASFDGGGYRAKVDVLARRFSPDWVAGWRAVSPDESRPDPVFLVGFPRSGTTLLETILMGHEAISVVEEAPMMQKVGDALKALPGGYPDGMAGLTQADLAALRRVYFSELDKHLERQERTSIIIDKNPLNLVAAGLIHRIFPRARFLFVQRHPCDCVLSCLMQNFMPNEAMANFLKLEDAAVLYDKVMSLWRQYRAVLALQVHTVRYEDLLETFEDTLAPLLDFLGVGWDDGVRDHVNTAYRRGQIKSASYNQVTQPLYSRARGRWRRYQEHMEPVLTTLLPWAEYLGYEI